jgi:hypothetical protein
MMSRSRVARLVAALYAFCILAPSLAFAFADSSVAGYCFVEILGPPPILHGDGGAAASDAAGAVHVHAGGMAHHHAGGASKGDTHSNSEGGKRSPAECCGLLSMVALAATLSASGKSGDFSPTYQRAMIAP